jgi:hypothetical protein
MKKIMSLMLGLSLILGTATVFAQDKAADSKTEKKSKKKSSKKAKKADTTEKKS